MRKGAKITAIVILALLLVAISAFAYYLYRCIQLEMVFVDEITEVEYGKMFDPESLKIEAKYNIEYPYIDTNKMGEKEYTFIVKDGLFKRKFTHMINVVDKTPPIFEVEYNIITTSTNTPSFQANIAGKITDNYDLSPKLEFIGEVGKKPGIYAIDFVVTDEAGNSFKRTVYYLYKLTPGNMKKPFIYPSEYGDVIIANKKIPVPKGYNKGIDKEAKKQMNKMLAAIKKAGQGSISIRSGFRSYGTQTALFARYARQEGSEEAANRYSARAGYSEHQTGYAFDIGKIDESFDQTKAFKWLQEHAHEYGFIMRYPKSKESITGYIYEPWHYRYVGVELATAVKQSGKTLEEFFKMK